MESDIVIVIGEDDKGHALLIKKNLERSGISNPIVHLEDGQQIIDYFYEKLNNGQLYKSGYILLLDIQMPKLGGIEVLNKLKSHSELRKVPVIMITTTDNPKEIEECHNLGCSSYIVKPIDYTKFIDIIKRLGFYLKIIQVPKIEKDNS